VQPQAEAEYVIFRDRCSNKHAIVKEESPGRFLLHTRSSEAHNYCIILFLLTLLSPSFHASHPLHMLVMPLRWPDIPPQESHCSSRKMLWHSVWTVFPLLVALVALADAMTPRRIGELRQETISMFYHGFDNYMQIAFPEDEVCFPTKLGT